MDSRRRAASSFITLTAMSGFDLIIPMNDQAVITRHFVSVTASTVADLGCSSNNDISPKKSPLFSSASVFLSFRTRTLPSSIRKNPTPMAPSSTIFWPGAKERPFPPAATVFSCFPLSAEKSGTLPQHGNLRFLRIFRQTRASAHPANLILSQKGSFRVCFMDSLWLRDDPSSSISPAGAPASPLGG